MQGLSFLFFNPMILMALYFWYILQLEHLTAWDHALCIKVIGKFATFAKILENTSTNGLRAFVEIKSKLEIKSACGLY